MDKILAFLTFKAHCRHHWMGKDGDYCNHWDVDEDTRCGEDACPVWKKQISLVDKIRKKLERTSSCSYYYKKE